MKIVVLGASGAVGKLVCAQALANGDDVVAVARGQVVVEAEQTPGKGTLRIEQGDLTDVAFLTRVMAGADVVISGLGLRLKGLAPWNRPEVPDFLDRSTTAVVAAMKANGLRRAVVVSSAGIGDSAATTPGFFKVFVALTAMRHVWPALNRMEEAWAGSGLDVTLVRPTGLTDGEKTGTIVEAPKLIGQASIARADVAAFMLAEARRADIRRAVVITTLGAAPTT